jgi:NAD(P)-dependent dehydrogenase (short-subunit alcohol dehydrogenase family)
VTEILIPTIDRRRNIMAKVAIVTGGTRGIGAAISSEALPQTDEACGDRGSDRRFMTSSGKTSLNDLKRSKRLQEAKPARPEPGR